MQAAAPATKAKSAETHYWRQTPIGPLYQQLSTNSAVASLGTDGSAYWNYYQVNSDQARQLILGHPVEIDDPNNNQQRRTINLYASNYTQFHGPALFAIVPYLFRREIDCPQGQAPMGTWTLFSKASEAQQYEASTVVDMMPLWSSRFQNPYHIVFRAYYVHTVRSLYARDDRGLRNYHMPLRVATGPECRLFPPLVQLDNVLARFDQLYLINIKPNPNRSCIMRRHNQWAQMLGQCELVFVVVGPRGPDLSKLVLAIMKGRPSPSTRIIVPELHRFDVSLVVVGDDSNSRTFRVAYDPDAFSWAIEPIASGQAAGITELVITLSEDANRIVDMTASGHLRVQIGLQRINQHCNLFLVARRQIMDPRDEDCVIAASRTCRLPSPLPRVTCNRHIAAFATSEYSDTMVCGLDAHYYLRPIRPEMFWAQMMVPRTIALRLVIKFTMDTGRFYVEAIDHSNPIHRSVLCTPQVPGLVVSAFLLDSPQMTLHDSPVFHNSGGNSWMPNAPPSPDVTRTAYTASPYGLHAPPKSAATTQFESVHHEPFLDETSTKPIQIPFLPPSHPHPPPYGHTRLWEAAELKVAPAYLALSINHFHPDAQVMELLTEAHCWMSDPSGALRQNSISILRLMIHCDYRQSESDGNDKWVVQAPVVMQFGLMHSSPFSHCMPAHFLPDRTPHWPGTVLGD